jgi:hypothetical protein
MPPKTTTSKSVELPILDTSRVRAITADSGGGRGVTAVESRQNANSDSPIPFGDSVATLSTGVLPPLDEASVQGEAQQRCVDYVFMQKVVNKAFVRLMVYAKYGPGVRQSDGSVRLAGAHRLLHHFEEKQLLAEEEDTFITDVYGGTLSSTSLTGTRRAVDDESRATMNRGKNALTLDALEMSRAELAQVLAGTVGFIGANSKHKSFDGSGLAEAVKSRRAALDAAAKSAKSTPSDLATSAAARSIASGSASRDRYPTAVEDAISTALLAERRRRISCLKQCVPLREAVRTDLDITQRKTRHFYNKTAPKAYEIRTWEDPKDVLRSLHRYAGAIMDPTAEKSNNVDVTLNVRCLRPDFVPDLDKPGWDGYCCVRNKQASKATSLR